MLKQPREKPRDREVHARNLLEGIEVVRYGIAGRWFLEPIRKDSTQSRQSVDVMQAAKYAVWTEQAKRGTIFEGVSGGQRFDKLVRQQREFPQSGEVYRRVSG